MPSQTAVVPSGLPRRASFRLDRTPQPTPRPSPAASPQAEQPKPAAQAAAPATPPTASAAPAGAHPPSHLPAPTTPPSRIPSIPTSRSPTHPRTRRSRPALRRGPRGVWQGEARRRQGAVGGLCGGVRQALPLQGATQLIYCCWRYCIVHGELRPVFGSRAAGSSPLRRAAVRACGRWRWVRGRCARSSPACASSCPRTNSRAAQARRLQPSLCPPSLALALHDPAAGASDASPLRPSRAQSL